MRRFSFSSPILFVHNSLSKERLRKSAYSLWRSRVCFSKSLQESEDALNDFAVTTGLKRQRSLLWQNPLGKGEDASEQNNSDLELFDLRQIGDKRDEFPNVFILGAPGTGKTTAAEYLGIVLKSGKRYAVHPHAKPSDFKGFDRIFGGGRNIGTPDDELIEWADIESGRKVPTVAQVFLALHQLMQDRYELYYKGQETFESIDVYFDELPAIAATLGQKFLSSLMPALICECRKVGIRLWFLSQAFQVKALGLQGVSDLREGATVIRLGKLAVKEAQSLVRSRALEPQALEYLRSADRPVLVDDMPAKLPRYTEMKAAILALCSLKNTEGSRSFPFNSGVQGNKPCDSLRSCASVSEENTRVLDSLRQPTPTPSIGARDKLSDLIEGAFTTENPAAVCRDILRDLRDSNNPRLDAAYSFVYLTAVKHGHSSNQIIKKFWGMSNKYTEGIELAKKLNLRP